MQKEFQVGIVGCGNIADQHLKFLTKMANVSVVGLVDVETKNAKALGKKYSIAVQSTSIEELLEKKAVDVLHICTPPAYHFEQAKFGLEKGIHIFLEKPLTLVASQVVELYKVAAEKGVSLCPNFLQLFLPRMSEAFEMIKKGRLGKVVCAECFYGVDAHTSEVYRSIGLPWSYNLPGGIFHNYLTHALYLVLNFAGIAQEINVKSRSFGILPQKMTDHLEVFIEGRLANAHVVLSAVPQTPSYYVRVFCQKGTMLADFHRLNVLVDAKGNQPNAVHRFVSNYSLAKQLFSQNTQNILNILRGRLIPYQGMQKIFEAFYAGLKTNMPPPVDPALAIAVANAEENIVAAVEKTRPSLRPRSVRWEPAANSKVALVTGGAGFLGKSLVRHLLEAGYRVRAYVRALSQVDALENMNVDIVFGDVREYDQLERAADGVDYIIHAAAGVRGPNDAMLEASVQGTEQVGKVARAKGIKQVVYISSTGIYDYSGLRNGKPISEQTALESDPDKRGSYTLAKRKAEDIALKNLSNQNVAWTILRPSVLFGNGRPVYTLLPGAMIGNIFICFGRKKNPIRLIHVDDVSSAVVRILESKASRGMVFNLSHPDTITIGQYFKEFRPKDLGKPIRVLFLPKPVWLVAASGMGLVAKFSRKKSSISRKQIDYWYCGSPIEPQRIQNKLGWQARELRIRDVLRDQSH